MPASLKEIARNIRTNVDWFGIREVKITSHYLVARNGKFEKCSTGIDYGYMIEVLLNGQFAYCAASNSSISAIQQACDRAAFLAQSMAGWNLFPFTKDERKLVSGDYATAVKDPFSKISKKEAIEKLIKATETMKVSDKVVNTSALFWLAERETHFVSSDGAEINQNLSQIISNLEAIAQAEGQIQSRTTGLPCFQGGLEHLDKDIAEDEARKVGEEAVELLSAESCPTGSFDLILSPDQLDLQLHESIGHPLEIDRILGDERNYAGWSFVQPSDFGNLQYGSSLLNVVFDPTVSHEFASYGFDDTGLRATREYLIKDGVLLRGLGGSESQKRSGLHGVACARASSWNRPPIDRMANVNIEPGGSSLEDMISGVEFGVYMMTNKSWSIDDYRRKFQFGCEYAKLIENGKITKTLNNPNYKGTTTDFWRNLKKVGDESTYEVKGSPVCGKGEPNQMVGVGHAVPTCLFEKVEIFGSDS